MLSEKNLYDEFDYYKKKAVNYYKSGKINECLEVMQLACIIARQYYLHWKDDDFENILMNLSKKITVNRTASVLNNKRRVIFYDTQATDHYVLTEQYLRAFLSWDIELMYITTKDLSEPNRKVIHGLLKNNNVKVCYIPEKTEYLVAAKKIVTAVNEFSPTKVFVQTYAHDFSGIIAFGALDSVEKYFIETIDHNFWLGTKVFDHYIVFRSFGYNVCKDHRGISAEKLIIQPFYPLCTPDKFKGIPKNSETSVRILSGARLEKIYGKNDKYFELIEDIIKQNKNVEFYYIGAGVYGKSAQTGYLEKQIKIRHLQDSMHFLGFRNDINSLMQNMDIYIGTYPIGGGLMTQIAAINRLPIVQFVSEGLSGSVGEFLNCQNKNQDFVFLSEKEFYQEVHKLVEDVDYRKKVSEQQSKCVLSEKQFNTQLYQIFSEGRSNYTPHIYDTDCKNNRLNQIEVENYCSHDFPRIVVKSRFIRKKQPFKYGINFLKFLWYTDKHWLISKIFKR